MVRRQVPEVRTKEEENRSEVYLKCRLGLCEFIVLNIVLLVYLTINLRTSPSGGKFRVEAVNNRHTSLMNWIKIQRERHFTPIIVKDRVSKQHS